MSALHTKFGELLKLERERQGITLTDVSEALKIAEGALQNIEDGNASALPSDLYFKMFSRSYAEHLGIDYARTIEAMREELGESLEPDTNGETQQAQKLKPNRDQEAEAEDEEPSPKLGANMRRLVILAGAIVGGFIIFLLAYQIFFSDDSNEGDAGPAETAVTGSGSEADKVISTDEAYNWNVPTYQPPDSIVLTLVARQESWASVVADGESVLRQTLTVGRQYRLTAKYRFMVSIAIPRVVDVTIDGQPAYLASAESGRIVRVEIDQTNRDAFGAPPEQARPSTPAAVRTLEVKTDRVDSALQGGSDSI